MGESIKLFSRRGFIALGGGVLGAAAAACGRKPAAEMEKTAPAGSGAMMGGLAAADKFPEDIPYAGFRMGVQSWCLREFKPLEQLIADVRELGLAHVELAAVVHLPVDSPDEKIREAVAAFNQAGITIDAFGVERMPNDEARCRRLFEYGKMIGALDLSAAPAYDALPLVDRLSEEYGIPVGIHNHGPEDKLYATPDMYREHLEGLSNRVGLLVDTGHYGRSGVDPLKVIEEFPERIHGVHLKDMVRGGAGEPEWVDRIVGEGELDLPGLMRKLKEIDFRGPLSLEYESDPSNPMPRMKECLAAVRKVCVELG